MIIDVHCPRCNSDALYSYGRIKNGKQRYLCLLCNRQFVPNRTPQEIHDRPRCPLCGGKMHVYRRMERTVRFRCAQYPRCRGYSKTSK